MEPVIGLRAATPADSEAIKNLLAAVDLPTAGVEKHLETFFVVETTLAGSAKDRGSPAGPGELTGELRAGPGKVRDGLVAEAGEIIGVGGLEIHGRLALLRSLSVHHEHRLLGIASRICDQLEERAADLGILRIFLLTETAESFFARRGYSVAARADAPAEIVATEEFTTLCPGTAVLMVRAC